METYKTVYGLLSKNCCMAKIDLKYAYFLLPVHATYRKYLRFQFQDFLYQFTCVPFGLNVAPRIFTKLMKPIAPLLRQRGFKLVVYLDDLLLIGRDYNECKLLLKETEELLISLGFVLNYEKSIFTPSTEIQFLGYIFNSVNLSIRLPS